MNRRLCCPIRIKFTLHFRRNRKKADLTSEPKILIIIPAFNEAECIEDTVSNVIAAGYDYVVVNDGSTDNTLRVCKDNGINVLDLKNNLGIGGAVQAGHKYAKAYGYDIDIQFDGDGQHDISYVPAVVREIMDGADLAIGSRFLAKKKDGFQSTFMRRVGIVWLSSLIKMTGGTKVTDPTSGFRACGRRAIDLYCRHYPTDYPEPESIVAALKQGLSVKECSVRMNERQGGESSIKALSSVYYMIKVSLAILIVGITRATKN